MRKKSRLDSLALRMVFSLGLLAPLACNFVTTAFHSDATATPAELQIAPETPTAQPTQLLLPNPSGTPGFLSPSITSVPIPTVDSVTLYKEDFKTPPPNWSTGKSDNDYMTIDAEVANGGYEWKVTAKQSMAHEAFSDPPVQLPEDFFIYGATAQVVNGPADMNYGLVFREQDTDNFYLFEVDQDGNYDVMAMVNNQWSTMIVSTPTKDLNLDSNDKNRLDVRGKGSDYEFFINNKLQTTLTDRRFSGGNIGLGIELHSSGDTADLIFHNLIACSGNC